MITSIEIDGFKTLRNFKMEFRPGLNVLAGVNGAGKTNILQALEFLSFLPYMEIDKAISNASINFNNIFYKNLNLAITVSIKCEVNKNSYFEEFRIIKNGFGIKYGPSYIIMIDRIKRNK